VIDLLRCVMRLPALTVSRLDAIATSASVALRCEVSRAAVIRAAVDTWLEFVERDRPEELIEEIRAAMIKRGRKPQ
jgi:hypothetical protein